MFHTDYSAALDEQQHELSEYIEDEGDNADEAEYIPFGEDDDLPAPAGRGAINAEDAINAEEALDNYDVNRVFGAASGQGRSFKESENGEGGGNLYNQNQPKHSSQYAYRKGLVNSDAVDGSLLEGDLLEYLKNERHRRKLRESGYYDIDDFLVFQ